MSKLTETIRDIDIGELLSVLYDSHYYEILFPFLLSFAVIYTVLERIKIFKYKKGANKDKPIKPALFIVSALVSYYGISFELSQGYSVGNFLMMLFPNISALTMGILGLYIVGSIFAKDFFSGLFDRKNSAFLVLIIGVIGIGSIIYYAGIAMGFWSDYPITNTGLWNTIFAIAFLILGIVFLFIPNMVPFALILLFVFGTFVVNYSAQESILELFIDPVIFILAIVAFLLSWLNSNDIKEQEKEYAEMEKSFNEDYGGKDIPDYKNRIHDIKKSALESKKKHIDKLKSKK